MASNAKLDDGDAVMPFLAHFLALKQHLYRAYHSIKNIVTRKKNFIHLLKTLNVR